MDTLPGEVWYPVFDYVVPGVKPYYYISNLGRMYSTQYKNGKGGLLTGRPQKCGYIGGGFVCNDCKRSVNVHRVEMMTFNPVENTKDLFVNHIDGNKSNNELSNLEWATPSRNAKHAYEAQLNKKRYGEDHHSAKHDNATVRKVCEALEQGMTLEQCCIYAGLEPTKENRKWVSRIKTKDCWSEISDEYDIPTESYEKREFTDREVQFICWDFMNGLSYGEIIDKYRPDSDKERREKLHRTLYKIKHQLSYRHITQFCDGM